MSGRGGLGRAAALALAAALAGGACSTPLAPLHRYNDRWQGQLKLPGKLLPLGLALYVTGDDERADQRFGKRVFGELSVGDIGPLAVLGEVSHFNRLERNRTSHAPIPDREFIELELRRATAFGNRRRQQHSAYHYQRAVTRLLRQLHRRPLRGRGRLKLVGERRFGSVLQGIALLEDRWTGACTHRRRNGRCRAWGVGARTIELGFFSVKRVAAQRVEIRGGVLKTRNFVFVRRQPAPGQVSWTMRLQPGLLHTFSR